MVVVNLKQIKLVYVVEVTQSVAPLTAISLNSITYVKRRRPKCAEI